MVDEYTLLEAIEAFLSRTGMTATAFGDDAMEDRMFVFDLRKGRECRRATRERALLWMVKNPNGQSNREVAA